MRTVSSLVLLAGCFPAGPASTSSPDETLISPTNPPTIVTSSPAPTVPTGTTCARPPSTDPIGLAVIRRVPLVGCGWELHAGRFLDENGDGVIDATDPQQLWVHAELGDVLVDGTGIRQTIVDNSWRNTSTVAEVDASSPGAEYLYQWYTLGDEHSLSWFGDLTELDREPLSRAEADGMAPWVADLDNDGFAEVVTSQRIRDAHTGVTEAMLNLGRSDVASRPLTADLDLDGAQEIIVWSPSDGAVLFDVTGARTAVCAPPVVPNVTNVMFGIGDLDGDPEGEWVTAGSGFVATCDTDGTLLASITVATQNIAMVGLGELDGDERAEIVIGSAESLLVLDDDLSVLFERTDSGYHGFSLVDLDGDGYHEILTQQRDPDSLLVLAGDGTVRGQIDTVQSGSWQAQPVVADLDGDGLAEIAVVGCTEVVVVDDGVVGGWNVPGASEPWPGVDRFPGDRGTMAEVPALGAVHWSTPESNVWQGLATASHPASDCPEG